MIFMSYGVASEISYALEALCALQLWYGREPSPFWVCVCRRRVVSALRLPLIIEGHHVLDDIWFHRLWPCRSAPRAFGLTSSVLLSPVASIRGLLQRNAQGLGESKARHQSVLDRGLCHFRVDMVSAADHSGIIGNAPGLLDGTRQCESLRPRIGKLWLWNFIVDAGLELDRPIRCVSRIGGLGCLSESQTGRQSTPSTD